MGISVGAEVGQGGGPGAEAGTRAAAIAIVGIQCRAGRRLRIQSLRQSGRHTRTWGRNPSQERAEVGKKKRKRGKPGERNTRGPVAPSQGCGLRAFLQGWVGTYLWSHLNNPREQL